MYEDVMFHARVNSPFSSSTSTLVDAPVATIDISKPSTPKLETAEAANADELKPLQKISQSDARTCGQFRLSRAGRIYLRGSKSWNH